MSQNHQPLGHRYGRNCRYGIGWLLPTCVKITNRHGTFLDWWCCIVCLLQAVGQYHQLPRPPLGEVSPIRRVSSKRGLPIQYAYFVKFTEDKCNKGLQTQDINETLKGDISADIRGIVEKKEIYQGNQTVAASYERNKKYDIHAESRLLNTLPCSRESPISNLLKRTPGAGCVVFFSLNSPCVQTCTNRTSKYNIIEKLNQVPLPEYKYRAFAYTKVFDKDKKRPEEEVWKNWEALDAKIQLLRCSGNNCIKCLNNGERNEKCYKD